MFDVAVTFEDRETTHRVIVGKEYYEDFEMEPEEILEMTFSFLLRKKTPRQTEGGRPCLYDTRVEFGFFLGGTTAALASAWWGGRGLQGIFHSLFSKGRKISNGMTSSAVLVHIWCRTWLS